MTQHVLTEPTALGRELQSACRKALYHFGMLDGVTKVAVALSGGKDSLSLLHLLHQMRGRGFQNFDLVAIHVKGQFSCGAGVDGRFLRSVCESLGIELIVRESNKRLEDLECYSCSRERRKLIFDAAKEIGCETIAFGHHRDDVAQTLLMNLLHKAEFASMLPKIRMHHYQVTIIRPLVYIKEEDLRTFASQSGFLRITCQCPVGQNSKRKETDRLLKQMELLYPHARSNLAAAALESGLDKASTP